jgi:hypothetical protein
MLWYTVLCPCFKLVSKVPNLTKFALIIQFTFILERISYGSEIYGTDLQHVHGTTCSRVDFVWVLRHTARSRRGTALRKSAEQRSSVSHPIRMLEYGTARHVSFSQSYEICSNIEMDSHCFRASHPITTHSYGYFKIWYCYSTTIRFCRTLWHFHTKSALTRTPVLTISLRWDILVILITVLTASIWIKVLFHHVLSGEVPTDKLVGMTAEQLANQELARWRERETKHVSYETT